jgi:hypothetical protein
MSEEIGSDQIMRDGEALPEPADEATASANEASVAVPHSPLPWSLGVADEPRVVDVAGRGVADCLLGRIGDASWMWAMDDATFIVRAVNNHAALLAALKAALPWVAIATAGDNTAWVHPQRTANHAEDLALIQAAVKQAEGGH